MHILKTWRRRRILSAHPIADRHWNDTLRRLRLLDGLDASELARLRQWTTLFLYQKSFTGARELELSDHMCTVIAAQACLLILNLDIDYYNDCREIVVYPDSFVVSREDSDDTGVVHLSRHELAGEAWEWGSVILSWADVKPGAYPYGAGTNVVIHEFAHQLDMLTGTANGLPPLHRNMDRVAWSTAFTQAYDLFSVQVAHNENTAIDPYAAESPGEFFAVLSEAFFEIPDVLQGTFADVYRQLVLFYRQDPVSRRAVRRF